MLRRFLEVLVEHILFFGGWEAAGYKVHVSGRRDADVGPGQLNRERA